MCELIVGFILGFVVNLITALLVSCWQFHFSTAHDHIGKTVEAMERIVGSPIGNLSSLRDDYRDYLGVVIDRLEQIWKGGDFKENIWPCLVHFADDADGRPRIANREGRLDPNADRWDLFNLYVRPIIQDISSYAFLGWFGWCPLFPKLRQLSALTELCNKLKTVVRRFDAAYEVGVVELAKTNDRVVIQPTTDSTESEDVKRLREAYRDLCRAWREWSKAAHL